MICSQEMKKTTTFWGPYTTIKAILLLKKAIIHHAYHHQEILKAVNTNTHTLTCQS